MNNQYPQDLNRLNQVCAGDANLDIWYNSQFIQNEKVNQISAGLLTTYALQKKCCLKNTFVGTVYTHSQKDPRLGSLTGNGAAFTFCEKDGKLVFTRVSTYVGALSPVGGEINYSEGFIRIDWNGPLSFQETHLVVSYEFDYMKVEARKTIGYGFPPDDMCSLDQRASDDNYIDYTSQFVENEKFVNSYEGKVQPCTLEMVPVIKGTVVGKILLGSELLIQTFTFASNGTFNVTSIGVNELPKVVSGSINYKTGNIKLTWNRSITPQMSTVYIHYEYNPEEREEYLKCLSR